MIDVAVNTNIFLILHTTKQCQINEILFDFVFVFTCLECECT